MRVVKQFALILPLLLAGCVDTAGKLEVDTNLASEAAKIERVAGANIAAAPLAIMRFEGLSPEQTTNFVDALQREGQTRQITFADAKKAKYEAQGYVSAFNVGKAVHFVYVWDVFDSGQHLRQRISDAVIIGANAPDPMALFSPEVSAALAAKSADDLAAVLSNMPEARGK